MRLRLGHRSLGCHTDTPRWGGKAGSTKSQKLLGNPVRVKGFGFRGYIEGNYMGIMEKKMETTIIRGVI